ncbi:putative phage terminase large subunit domain protein [Escherichia coli DEC10A]|nr:putative phage terminase large subunit domain protein [Escherichia coli DEC10A]
MSKHANVEIGLALRSDRWRGLISGKSRAGASAWTISCSALMW